MEKLRIRGRVITGAIEWWHAATLARIALSAWRSLAEMQTVSFSVLMTLDRDDPMAKSLARSASSSR
jgi:hypothetical protein